MRARSSTLLLSLLLALGACAKHEAGDASAPAVAGETAKPGSLLAYEHEVDVEVAPEAIQRRVDDVRAACNDARFGACSVLALQVAAGEYASGSITVRCVPAAVEPLVKLGVGADPIGRRTTHAEDLADEVARTSDRREFLERQRTELEAMKARSDLSVSELIALSQQAATVEQELQSLAQANAAQQRRIETNKLTLEFSTSRRSASSLDVGDLGDTFTESLSDGISEAASYLGYLLPLLLLAFPLALAWRAAWRRVTRRGN
ncbi:MAG TPA: DUF4349 domain-containing protein [Xanthomonadales bacterium]|nr:DUF4349 domain-containing protein [Xanthomonadales bacterium]